MNNAAMLVAASSGPPTIVGSAAQALLPAMVGALAFIVAAAVTVLAVFMQSERSARPGRTTHYAQVACALVIVYLLIASFCSLRDAIYALTTRPPETLTALRGVAWTILFPALCGLVALGAVACIMMVHAVRKWTEKIPASSKAFPFIAVLLFAIAFGPAYFVGNLLSPHRVILLPGWLVKIVVIFAIIAMTVFVVWIKKKIPVAAQPAAAKTTGVVGEQPPPQ